MNEEKRDSGNLTQRGSPALYCLPLRFKGTQLHYIIIGGNESQFSQSVWEETHSIGITILNPKSASGKLGRAVILHCYGCVASLGI